MHWLHGLEAFSCDVAVPVLEYLQIDIDCNLIVEIPIYIDQTAVGCTTMAYLPLVRDSWGLAFHSHRYRYIYHVVGKVSSSQFMFRNTRSLLTGKAGFKGYLGIRPGWRHIWGSRSQAVVGTPYRSYFILPVRHNSSRVSLDSQVDSSQQPSFDGEKFFARVGTCFATITYFFCEYVPHLQINSYKSPLLANTMKAR